MSNTTNHRAFVLPAARVYLPGSLPKEVYEAAPNTSGGGCCGSAPVPRQESSTGCGTSSCDADHAAKQSKTCC